MVDIAIGREQPSGIERNKKSLATELIISPSLSLYVRKRTISSIYQGFEERFSFLPQRSSVGVDNTRRKSDRLGREERMRKDSEPSPLSYNRFQATRVYKSFGRPPINLGRPRLVRTCTLLCPVPSTFSRPNSRVPDDEISRQVGKPAVEGIKGASEGKQLLLGEIFEPFYLHATRE